jgi:hypothetical protein
MTPTRIAAITAIAATIAVGGAAATYAALREDPGVGACQALADGDGKHLQGRGDTQAERITAMRSDFAKSNVEDLRTHGVKFTDLSKQIAAATKSGDQAAALPLIGSFTETYAGLAGACASEGVEIPALSDFGD